MVGPLFPEILTSNGGIFPHYSDEVVERGYAAWYIAKCCHKALHEIPSQVSLEGDTDVTVNLRAIAEGCAAAYGIHDLNEVMLMMPLCRRWAFKTQRQWDDRFQAWLDSGGKAYDEVTREPEKI